MTRTKPQLRGLDPGSDLPLCPACGRRIRVTWPARSLLCRCGAQVLPRPATAPEPGFLRHGTGSMETRSAEPWPRKPHP
jgi:hypothetical protein